MIRLMKPDLKFSELDGLEEVINSGFLTNGVKVEEFEKKVGEYVGTKYAVATTSATTALHLSLATLGITQNDEVLVADFTFPATANVVVQQGAKPVLIDIILDSYTIAPDKLEEKITKRTKAIIPVHAFGQSADMDPIMDIAKKHGLFVIEDAACALGTTYKGRKCGGIGDVGCFSFHPRKAITTGEGGMVVTNIKEVAEKAKTLRNHGGVFDGLFYRFEFAGFNYRMTEIQALMGLSQINKIEAIIERRILLAKMYEKKLKGLPGIMTPIIKDWGRHVFQSYVVLLEDGIDRDKIVLFTRHNGVETTLGTYALHPQPFFMQNYGYKKGELINSYKAYKQALTLPLFSDITEDDMDLVVEMISKGTRAQ